MRLILLKILDPVDTGRKLNVHKTFRRRPGRLLNVLCMFNLRPVSTGESITLVSFCRFCEVSKAAIPLNNCKRLLQKQQFA